MNTESLITETAEDVWLKPSTGKAARAIKKAWLPLESGAE